MPHQLRVVNFRKPLHQPNSKIEPNGVNNGIQLQKRSKKVFELQFTGGFVVPAIQTNDEELMICGGELTQASLNSYPGISAGIGKRCVR